MDNFYKGYRVISGTSDEVTEQLENPIGWYTNQYAIIHNSDDGSTKEMRWNGEKFVALKLPPSKFIKGKNALQRCALDMLINPEITVCALLGLPGSGKTFQAVQCGVYCVREKGYQSRILGLREPLNAADGRELGFLPGDLASKAEFTRIPFQQQFEGEQWEVDRMQQREEIDFNIIAYIKGQTFNSSYVIVDEAEDLSKKQIKLVGTRLGVDSKVVFDGDIKQSEIDTSKNNPLQLMCNELKGNPLFACVTLEEDVRSETSKLFATLFENEKD